MKIIFLILLLTLIIPNGDVFSQPIQKDSKYYLELFEKYHKFCNNFWSSDQGSILASNMCAETKPSMDLSKCIDDIKKKKLEECGVIYQEGRDFYKKFIEKSGEKEEKTQVKKFPDTLKVYVSAYCRWEWPANGSNIHKISYYNWHLQGSVKAKERKKDFIRYESNNTNAHYSYYSNGIMKDKGDICYGKIVNRAKGQGFSAAYFNLDIFIGQEWAKFTNVPRDSYSLFINFEVNYLTELTDPRNKDCELRLKQRGIMPFALSIPYEPLFSNTIVGIKKAGEPGFTCPGEGYAVWQFK